MPHYQVDFTLTDPDNCPYQNSQLDAWRLSIPPHPIHPGELVHIRLLDTNGATATYIKTIPFKVAAIEHRYYEDATTLQGEQSLLIEVEYCPQLDRDSLDD